MSEDLKKRIEILERKLERQIQARRNAEEQLERYSKQVHQSSEALRRSVLEAQKKQTELEFLARSTAHTTSEESLSDLFSTTLQLCGEFSNALLGACFFVRNGKLSVNSKPLVWLPGQSVTSSGVVPPVILDYLPFQHQGLLHQWSIRELELAERPEMKWLVAMNFPYSEGQYAWMALCLSSRLLDEEALFVLDTVRKQLREGVDKRLRSANSYIQQSVLEQTAEHLATAKKQLVQAERMSTLGQISAGIAHEINNPVGFIKSNLDILSEHVKKLTEFYQELSAGLADKSIDASNVTELAEKLDVEYVLQDSLEIIADNQEGVRRIAEIVANLKSFSHVVDVEFEKVDVNQCVKQSLKIARTSFQHKHHVSLALATELPAVLGNSGQLQQVFINLIVNAGQAMGAVGQLSIETKHTNKGVCIVVSDTGHGMDEDTQSKLFTPFFTTKDVGQGTGLGLSVSRTLVEAHQGDITVESLPEIGTKMSVILPAYFD